MIIHFLVIILTCIVPGFAGAILAYFALVGLAGLLGYRLGK